MQLINLFIVLVCSDVCGAVFWCGFVYLCISICYMCCAYILCASMLFMTIYSVFVTWNWLQKLTGLWALFLFFLCYLSNKAGYQKPLWHSFPLLKTLTVACFDLAHPFIYIWHCRQDTLRLFEILHDFFFLFFYFYSSTKLWQSWRGSKGHPPLTRLPSYRHRNSMDLLIPWLCVKDKH